MADPLVKTRKRYNLRSGSQPASKRFKSSEGTGNRSSQLQSSSTSLLNINDDCLFEIFKYVNLTDLCSLAGVCTGLKTLTKQFFSYEYNKGDNKYFDMVHKLLTSESNTPLIYARSLLSNFGEFMVNMKISCVTTGDPTTSRKPNHRNIFKLMQLIAKYCQNLTDLTVSGFKIKQNDVEIWKSLFSHLTRLSLMFCEVFDLSSVLSPCSKLKYLKMGNIVYEDLEMLTNLEAIKLNHCDIDEEELMDFIRVNKNLTKLSIMRCPMVEKIDFKAISNLKNLREFELNQHLRPGMLHFQKEIQQLSDIRSLEKLSLNCYGRSVSSLISNLVIKKVPIQYLHLTNSLIGDQMINDIARLSSIKTLKIDFLEDKDLVKLTSELKSLVELDVQDSKVTEVTIRKMLINAQRLTILKIGSPNLKIDDAIYDRMLNIVKKRYPELKLNFYIYGIDYDNITVSREKINAKILAILTMTYAFTDNFELDFDTGDELANDTEDEVTADELDYDSDDQILELWCRI